MDPIWGGIIAICVLLVLLVLEVPISFSLGFAGLVGILVIRDWNVLGGVLARFPFSYVGSFSFIVVPLFIFMSHLSATSGLTRKAYDVGMKWLGGIPGGLGVATVAACAMFGGACGSSVADAAALGRVAIPEMRRYNYSPPVAAAIVASTGALAILIPPSGMLVIYGIITDVSIVKLLIAGILPGVVSAIIFGIAVVTFALLRPEQYGGISTRLRFTWREKFVSLKGTVGLVILFISVMGTIWTGIATPTEAAALGCAVATVIMLFTSKRRKKDFIDGIGEAAGTTSMVFAIIVCAGIFTMAMTMSQIPQKLALYFCSLPLNRWILVSVIVFPYLILGCFLDGISMLVLTLPIVFPIVTQLGFDGVWFGIIVTITVEIGVITPPVGLNVYVIKGIVPDIPVGDIFRAIVPYIVVQIVILAIMMAFPSISLFLPQRFG